MKLVSPPPPPEKKKGGGTVTTIEYIVISVSHRLAPTWRLFHTVHVHRHVHSNIGIGCTLSSSEEPVQISFSILYNSSPDTSIACFSIAALIKQWAIPAAQRSDVWCSRVVLILGNSAVELTARSRTNHGKRF